MLEIHLYYSANVIIETIVYTSRYIVDYKYDTIDKTYQGIMVITFMHKYSEYSFLLVAGYLPPEGSAWGRDAVSFYAHVLRTVYLYNSECDAIYFSYDLNSKFGQDLDFNTSY